MDFFTAFIAAIGISSWIYFKVLRRGGGNPRDNLIITGVIGLIIFLVVFTVIKTFFSS